MSCHGLLAPGDEFNEIEIVDVITKECGDCSINANSSPSVVNNLKKRIYSQTAMAEEQKTFQAKKLRIDQAFDKEAPKLLPELLENHIIPFFAKDWLGVSKEWNKVALDKLPSDPRVKLSWSSLERAVSCHSVSGVARHITPMIRKEHSISVWYTLDVAIEKNSPKIAEYVLSDSRMAQCSTLSEKLWKAVRWDRPDIVSLLLQYPSLDVTQCGARAISLALSLCRYTIIDILRQDERIPAVESATPASPWVMPPGPFSTPNVNMSFLYLLHSHLNAHQAAPPAVNYPSYTSYDLVSAVEAGNEAAVKKILKDDQSIPLNTLHEAAEIAMRHFQYKLTNMIQQAIKRRVKIEHQT